MLVRSSHGQMVKYKITLFVHSKLDKYVESFENQLTWKSDIKLLAVHTFVGTLSGFFAGFVTCEPTSARKQNITKENREYKTNYLGTFFRKKYTEVGTSRKKVWNAVQKYSGTYEMKGTSNFQSSSPWWIIILVLTYIFS